MTKKITRKHKKTGPKGPRKMTEEIIRKLEDGFKSDFTVSEACAYAGISTETYYKYLKGNKQFSDKIASAKEYCFIMAKNGVRKGLATGDFDSCLKRLKNRQNKIYSEKNETEHSGKVEISDITINIGN